MRLAPFNIVTAVAICLLMCGCAQEGPPVPPSLQLPKPPTDLRATRKGNKVTLTWSAPTVTTDRLGVRSVGTTVVCRDSKPPYTTCESAVGKLASPAPAAGASRKKKSAKKAPSAPAAVESLTDVLPAELLRDESVAEVIYAVKAENSNGRAAGLSNLVHVPAMPTLPAPDDLSLKLSGEGVLLTWTSAAIPQTAHNNSSSKIQYRYRVYRRDEASGKDAVAGEVGLTSGQSATSFTDATFEWEKTYSYRVTAVSIVTHAPEAEMQVEGDDSSSVRVVAHDIFPPAVPSALQATFSGEGQKPFIDLIWPPVVASDLAGYNVYRAEGAAPEKMVRVNTDLVKSPSYRDADVQPGKTYFYSVSSVDSRANESQKSDAASESVP